MRRVVITGLGAVTPIGASVKESWDSLINHKCGIRSVLSSDRLSGREKEIFSKLPVTIGALVPDSFDPNPWNDPQTSVSLPRVMQYSLCAATEAFKDAGLSLHDGCRSERLGVCLGTGIGDLKGICDSNSALETRGINRVSPFFVPNILCNGPAGHVAKRFKAKALLHSVSTACTTGLNSIGDAFRFIQNNDADIVIAGASESCIHPLAYAGFLRLKSLALGFNDKPSFASRPFSSDRCGFTIGEGAGILVLEEYNHAISRKARIYAEIIGYGLSCDAHHLTSPPEDGYGAVLAMRNALKQLNGNLGVVKYVNAHATSTAIGDAIEGRAVKKVFQSDSSCSKDLSVPKVSSSKGHIGHLLGAAGAVEAIFTVLSLHNQILIPTLNLKETEPEMRDLPLLSGDVDHSCTFDYALSNSFGFYGTNASILLKRWNK